MSAALEVFRYADAEVRTIVEDGDIWFVAADVCTVLEHSDPSKAVAGLDDDEKGRKNVRTLGGQQSMVVVNEPGLYALVIRSRKPEARAFRRWITHDVIPAIRRTGSYRVPDSPAHVLPASYAEALYALAAQVEETEKAEQRARELEAPAAAWTRLASAAGDYSMNQAAKILSRDPGIVIGERKLFEAIQGLGWIYRDKRYGSGGAWSAYQSAIDCGRLVHRTRYHEHPHTGATVLDAPQVRVTIKGLTDLHRHLGGIAPIAQALGHEDGAA